MNIYQNSCQCVQKSIQTKSFLILIKIQIVENMARVNSIGINF
jgi:hypothetical protein